jgi:dihydroorotate dehydrogenase
VFDTLYLGLLALWGRLMHTAEDSGGFTTAELLANAALAIAALVVIWTALRALGVNVVTDITNKLNQF